MRATLFLITLALSSAACSSPAEIEQAAGVEGETAPRAVARAEAAEGSAFEDDEERDGGSREFSYAWPAAVTAEPALARMLTAERDRTLAQEKVEWTDALSDSPQDCTPCRNRSFAKEWKVVANTPKYLSLSADFSAYTGGAHGMYGLQSLVWDKAKQRAMSGAEMFRSPEALDAALGPRLCSALNAERSKRRGESVPETSEDMFDRCVGTAEATVLIGSSTGKAFDRIGIWFGPYVAGSYAEGAYELDFPVDDGVLRAVKPEFAPAFAVRR
jgi:hypothetical protein